MLIVSASKCTRNKELAPALTPEQLGDPRSIIAPSAPHSLYCTARKCHKPASFRSLFPSPFSIALASLFTSHSTSHPSLLLKLLISFSHMDYPPSLTDTTFSFFQGLFHRVSRICILKPRSDDGSLQPQNSLPSRPRCTWNGHPSSAPAIFRIGFKYHLFFQVCLIFLRQSQIFPLLCLHSMRYIAS